MEKTCRRIVFGSGGGAGCKVRKSSSLVDGGILPYFDWRGDKAPIEIDAIRARGRATAIVVTRGVVAAQNETKKWERTAAAAM